MFHNTQFLWHILRSWSNSHSGLIRTTLIFPVCLSKLCYLSLAVVLSNKRWWRSVLPVWYMEQTERYRLPLNRKEARWSWTKQCLAVINWLLLTRKKIWGAAIPPTLVQNVFIPKLAFLGIIKNYDEEDKFYLNTLTLWAIKLVSRTGAGCIKGV